MNTVDILIEGYAKIEKEGWIASGTTTLITTDVGLHIVADAGTNRKMLLEALKARGLSLEDIDFSFVTHHHLDHAMLIGIFPNARIVDKDAIDWQDVAIESPKMIPDTDISIIATPGHELAHAILVVPTKDGTVVIAGDNFWWTTNEKQTMDVYKHDEFAENMEDLVKSRKEVLDLADWIIPGHGRLFQNKR